MDSICLRPSSEQGLESPERRPQLPLMLAIPVSDEPLALAIDLDANLP